MTPIAPADLLSSLVWRYATKKFDATKTIPANVWAALEQALILSPSSFGLQPWKFIVVTDPAVKQALVPVSWGQTQPADCSHHVVFAARKSLAEVEVDQFIASITAARGGKAEDLKGYRDMMTGFASKAAKEGWIGEWAIRQTYIALGNFMTSCAVLGVDACPMEGIAPDQYNKILGLEGSDYTTVVACAAGYRATDDKSASLAKVRYPASVVVVNK